MASEEAPPRELVVDARPAPGDSSTGSGTAMLPFIAPVAVAGGLAKLVSPTIGLVGLGVSVLIVVLLRKPKEGRFLLRVADGHLEVTRERWTTPGARVPLADVLDVTLERKTSAASGRGGGATERVRLALEQLPPAPPIFVPDEPITPIEAQEWYGKVRVFLRKHGWIPKDER